MRRTTASSARLAVLLSLLAGCGSGGDAAKSPPAAPPAASAPAPAPAPAADPALAGAEAAIQGLYNPYLNGGSGGQGIWTPGLTSASLAALLEADRRASEASGEPGALDYDIVANGQDFQVSDVRLAASGDASRATVVASFKNYDQLETVTYELVQESGAWKVDNVRTKAGGDLRSILSAKPR